MTANFVNIFQNYGRFVTKEHTGIHWNASNYADYIGTL